MRFVYALLLLISAWAALVCETSETLISTTVRTKEYSKEQSYHILNGAQVLAQSVPFFDNTVMEYEHCILKSSTDIYELVMRDKGGDAWTLGSMLTIRGEEGNVVFQGWLDESGVGQKKVLISLFKGVSQKSSWYFFNKSPPSDWKSYNCEACKTWQQVSPTDSPVSTTGTVYVRNTFTGRAGIAAYELCMKYQYGVIAYINGVQKVRDNMPAGSISHDTLANSHHDYDTDRCVIRTGLEVESVQSVIAVEFHYENTNPRQFRMIGSVSLYNPSLYDNCYVSNEQFSLNSDAQPTNPQPFKNAMDNDFSSYWKESVDKFFIEWTYGNFVPQVNAFAVYSNYARDTQPSSFRISGSLGATGDLVTVFERSGYRYKNDGYELFKMSANDINYRRYRFEITKTIAEIIHTFEIIPLTCSFPVPVGLSYNVTELVLHRDVEIVSLLPNYDGFTTCSGNLPAGLTVDPDTCIITGIATTDTAAATYTITAKSPKTTSVDIRISVVTCLEHVLEVRRVYGLTDSTFEAFSIMNMKNNVTVILVEAFTTQVTDTTVTTRHCLTTGVYELMMWSYNDDTWAYGSYISLSYRFPHDKTNKIILERRYDAMSGWNMGARFNLDMHLRHGSPWYYAMSDFPHDWNTGTAPDVAVWTEAIPGSIPASTNQLQFYRAKIDLTAYQIGCGFEFEVKYKGGVVIYVHEYEIYRHNLAAGEISNTTFATTEYEELDYHRIAFPINQVKAELSDVMSNADVLYVTVILIAKSATDTASTFAASVEVFKESSYGRLFDFTATASDFPTDAKYAFDQNSVTEWSSSADMNEEPRHIEIAFKTDRRDWISKYFFVIGEDLSHLPMSWVFQGRNPEDNLWTTIHTVDSCSWWQSHQRKNFYFINNKQYNKYRWYNIKTKEWATNRRVDITEIGVVSDEMKKSIPDLSYGPELTGYAGSELTTAYPNSEIYTRFTIDPPLPLQITLDYTSGIIQGTKLEAMPATVYEITAFKPNGANSTATVTITVLVCEDTTVVSQFLLDSFPYEMQWWLRRSHKTTGEQLYYRVGWPIGLKVESVYFCLKNDQYNVDLFDRFGDGWFYPASWRMFELNTDFTYGFSHLPEGQIGLGVHKVIGFTVGTVAYPGKSEYRILRSDTIVSKWNEFDFDATKWATAVGGKFDKFQTVTNYVRLAVKVDRNSCSVLSVLMKFTGGVIGYLNGDVFVRVALPAAVSPNTKSTTAHNKDSTVSANINTQIMMRIAGETQVLAFEVHYPEDGSGETINTFDAFVTCAHSSGCTMFHNKYSYITGTKPVTGELAYLVDELPYEKVEWIADPSTVIEWGYEDLVGLKFNDLLLYSTGESGLTSFNLYGKRESDDEYITITKQHNLQLPDRDFIQVEIPNGVIGFRSFKLVLVSATNPPTVSLTELAFAYCTHGGTLCAADGDYPSVANSYRSCAPCGKFLDGYRYKICHQGVFGKEFVDECRPFNPRELSYPAHIKNLYTNVKYEPILPVIWGTVTTWTISPPIFAGLDFSNSNGGVSGLMTEKPPSTEFTVTAANSSGQTTFTFTIAVIEGVCRAESGWSDTSVGSIAKRSCKEMKGKMYIGTIRRECGMDTASPGWKGTYGSCMSVVVLVVVISVVVILLLAIIISTFTVQIRKAKKTRSKVSKEDTRTEKASLLVDI